MLFLVCFLIFLALCFDFINGFHDAANAIATIIATGVLKPWQAMLWAAMFNFLAFFIFPLHVATTISSGIITNDSISNTSLIAILLGAISFNLSTWWLKLPSSSSHALIGALVGVGLMTDGWNSLYLPNILIIFLWIFISPLIGLFISYFLIKITIPIRWIDKKWFNKIQLFSSALLSIGHGGNDAQKTMGIITLVLYSNGYINTVQFIPLWIVLSCYTVIALGTLAGGRRIIETVGYKIIQLKPLSAACAELGTSCTLFLATHFGIPVSTTHALTGAIVGASAYHSASYRKANWRIVKKIFLAWIFTFPIAALFSAIFLKIITTFI